VTCHGESWHIAPVSGTIPGICNTTRGISQDIPLCPRNKQTRPDRQCWFLIYKRIQRYSVLGIGDKEWYNVIGDAQNIVMTVLEASSQSMLRSRLVLRLDSSARASLHPRTSPQGLQFTENILIELWKISFSLGGNPIHLKDICRLKKPFVNVSPKFYRKIDS